MIGILGRDCCKPIRVLAMEEVASVLAKRGIGKQGWLCDGVLYMYYD